MLRRLVREDIECVVDLGLGAGTVYADPRQIEHVLVNLVVNARDAIHGAGRIVIDTQNVSVESNAAAGTPSGDWVQLRVIDDGIGMSRDVLERIFEPFFTTKPAGEGTGLGLAMVYGIVEQSGGVIRAESSPEAGATFTILFPRAAQLTATRPTPISTPAVAAAGELVLLAEDEEPVRVLARRVLERAGYEVLIASNGREALEILDRETRTIDLVVSDIVMPEMGGLELAEHVRARRPGSRLLFMSGYAGAEIDRRGGLPADAQFLQKPFGPAALANAVREAIARSA
jgi:CheY-like chemotaxis protein